MNKEQIELILDKYTLRSEAVRKQHREYMRKRERMLRAKIFEIKGSKCENCGSINKLQIHHWNSLKLGMGGVKEREEDWILKHMNDVQLLCINCHRNIHGALGRLKRKSTKSYYSRKLLKQPT